MVSKLQGKIALVTGGISGIGKSIAELFIRNGAKVIAVDIKSDKENQKSRIDYLNFDVSMEDHWHKIITHINSKYGKLNILVNNAGINGFQYDQNPEDMSLKSWNYINKVNITSIFLGCKYSIPIMKVNNESSSIINISSRSGIVGVPNLAAYAASKASIRNYTKSVALYCAQKGYNIRCNTISPAAIDTDMWEHLKKDNDRLKLYVNSLPLKRMGNVLEVAHAALYLASNESSYTTGSEIIIDGGILATGIGLPK